MKRWTLALGCYGFMVCAAQAGERWSAETCKHLQEMKAETYAAGLARDQTSWMLTPILKFQRDKCGVDTKAEFEAGQRALTAPAPRAEKPAAARRPTLCDITPKAYGGSTTDCF